MATDAIPPKKLKKLPFKPTALGRPASSRSKDPESDDYDVTKLFSRSREMAPALHAEEEERWKRKQDKLKKELEKSRLSAEKRPIDDDDEEEHSSPGASQATEKASASGSQKRDARGDRHQEDSVSQADEEDEEAPSQSSTNVKIDDEEPAEDDIIEEEEEFAEYVQRAKEQRARDLSRDLDFDCDDKAVRVHVSSQIDGTRDCLVIVKYDKSLKDIRKSWFQTQAKFDISLPPAFTMSDSILTWCGAPVYSHTSLRDLAIRPCGSDGTVVLMRIHTPEGFRIFEEEKRRKREAHDFEDDEADEMPESEAVILTINLAARDLEPAEMKVQPETTVDTVITTYRAIQNLPSSRQITLWFDGEMLEDYITMKDADIDDLDTIEVHIK
uniref:Ubiquitin-like domain-containing protein n=1 Tax=Bionectria ochroleuca TaxID=29856 RepID=A0A0B7JWN7_BIOOC